jgi:hypothetical protein
MERGEVAPVLHASEPAPDDVAGHDRRGGSGDGTCSGAGRGNVRRLPFPTAFTAAATPPQR